jgi:hypothetical protein
MRFSRCFTPVLLLGAVSAGLTLAVLAAAQDPEPANKNSPLAINLSSQIDWASGWAFVDAFKSSRRWISSSGDTFDDGQPLDLDAHGWVQSLRPGQRAETFLLNDLRGGVPSGHYLVLYEGQGTLEYFGAPLVTELSTPGRDVLNIDAARLKILGLTITATNPADYLRNIRVIMPGGVCANDQFIYCLSDGGCPGSSCSSFESNYQTQIFHPLFLNNAKRFAALRFMDWMETNNPDAKQSAWNSRPKVEDAQWSYRGVPAEIMIELANRLQADAWFSMPHLATDDYVKNFAALAESRLQPERRIYVEYSNEVWNGLFDQSVYAQQRGLELGLSSDPFEAQMRYHSQRSVEVFRIWSSKISTPARLVRVMGGWSASAWTNAAILDWQSAYQQTDTLAIAPYFGYEWGRPKIQNRVAKWSVKRLLRAVKRRSVPEAFEQMEENLAAAQLRGLKLVAYEGGQHLVGYGAAADNRRLGRLFQRANRNSGMYDIYINYLSHWLDLGGDMFFVFTNVGVYDIAGSWGLMETYFQESPPKYNAVMEIIRRYSQ